MAAALALPAAYLLLPMDAGRERNRPTAVSADPPPSAVVDVVVPAVVAPVAAPAAIEWTVAEPTSEQALETGATTVETGAGTLSIVPGEDGGCQRIGLPDGDTLPGLCEDRIVFAHRAVFPDREVVAGFTRCADVQAPCGLGRPFWLELRSGSPPLLRQMPSVWAGSGEPVVSASSAGVRIDLGVWDGERRQVTLSPAGNIVAERASVPIRPLRQADCALVARSLEDCAASRDCSSFASAAQPIPAARWDRIVRMYHESTGLDVAAFRRLCVRSCELRLTPSAALVSRYACNGAQPDQWPLDDPAGGLQRE